MLYVGKAKNLKRRVSSYFQKSHPSPRTTMMVARIERVDVTVVRFEGRGADSLRTISSSLCAHRFNILFRDDKSYPYIAISRATNSCTHRLLPGRV